MQQKVLRQKLKIFTKGGDGILLNMGPSHISRLILMIRMWYCTTHFEHIYNSTNTHYMTQYVKCPHKHWNTLTLHTTPYSKNPTYLIKTKLHETIFLFFFSGTTAHFRAWLPQLCSPIGKQLVLWSCSFQSLQFLYFVLCCLPYHWRFSPSKPSLVFL